MPLIIRNLLSNFSFMLIYADPDEDVLFFLNLVLFKNLPDLVFHCTPHPGFGLG